MSLFYKNIFSYHEAVYYSSFACLLHAISKQVDRRIRIFALTVKALQTTMFQEHLSICSALPLACKNFTSEASYLPITSFAFET